MRLLELSANIPTFRNIKFNNDFSIIVGNTIKKGDVSHNLGKTTVLNLIRYVLFNGSGDFLRKFKSNNPDASFTINYLSNNTNLSFSRNFHRRNNSEPKEIETIINYEYFIRTQDELNTNNGFMKPKYKGKQIYWKPTLFSILGFDSELMEKFLQSKWDCEQLEIAIKSLKNIQSNQIENDKKIEELENQKKEIQKDIDKLILFKSESKDIDILVKDIDNKLYSLKSSIYEQKTEIRKILYSLEKIKDNQFDSTKVEEIFNQINLYFETQVKHSFAELNTFYESIYLNRKKVLTEKLKNAELLLHNYELEANNLDEERASLLGQLSNQESINIYEAKHRELTEIEKKIVLLSQTKTTENITELETKLSKKKTEELEDAANLSRNIDESRIKFDEINKIYKDIMKSVLKIDSEVKIVKRSTGNIDFEVASYKNGTETSELGGDSAKKLSAAAIDIAIRCVQNADHGFLAQDGIIDALNKSSAELFIKKVKELSQKYDFQYITTALKENLPDDISERDIVIELYDQTDAGRLFGFIY